MFEKISKKEHDDLVRVFETMAQSANLCEKIYEVVARKRGDLQLESKEKCLAILKTKNPFITIVKITDKIFQLIKKPFIYDIFMDFAGMKVKFKVAIDIEVLSVDQDSIDLSSDITVTTNKSNSNAIQILSTVVREEMSDMLREDCQILNEHLVCKNGNIVFMKMFSCFKKVKKLVKEWEKEVSKLTEKERSLCYEFGAFN